ncbi:MAG: MFS transporter [Hyphomicrobiales bacterium]|nr:MFS transporter [Hyphomicrobiales bacterium]MCP5370865.1 MFS transporter [Hyphomicrobiales bacterium]
MTPPGDADPQPAYRWVIVIASAVMLAVSMGMMVNGASVLIIPLHAEFGWDRGAVSLVNFAGLMGMAIGGILMGRLADRGLTRKLSLMGTVVLGACLLAAARADALWQLYALFFIAGLLGAGALFAPLVANVGNWFRAGAGLALGIASAGQALGQGGVPYGLALLISGSDWRGALTVAGAVTLAGMLPLALLIREPAKAPPAAGAAGGGGTDPALLPLNVTIAWLGIAVVFCCTCMSVPLMHLVPLIQDRGIALEDAGSVMFVMLLVAIAGRVAFGRLADVIGAVRAYWIASCWQTVLVFAFIQMHDLPSFYALAVIYGFGYAGIMTSILVCVRELIPPARRAFAMGAVGLFGWLGHGIGGYQGGFFFDLTGDYTLTYANAALAGVVNLFIVGALFLTLNRRRAALAAA